MHTEKAAKQKCCPVYEISKLLGLNGMIQYQMKGVDVQEHLKEMQKTGRCIASDCMMWRWDYREPKTGYCGLAGAQPEP